MKQLTILLTTLVFLTSATSFAAHPKKKKSIVETTNTSEPAVQHTTATTTVGRNIEMSAGISLGTINSRFSFGPTFQVELPVNIEGNLFKFGGATAFYYGSSSGVSAWSIPIMATGTYLFKIDNPIKPYFGLEMGIAIDHGSAGAISNTQVDFAFLAKPGINFGYAQTYFFELPIGTLQQSFTLMPTFGLRF